MVAAIKVARAKNSAVLASNAVHHRVDSLTAMAALISIAASNMFPSLVGLDPLAALVISAMVIRAGTTNVWSSLTELADQAIADPGRQSKVENAVRKTVESFDSGNFEIAEISGIKSGQNYLWQINLVAPDSATVSQLGQWEEDIRKAVAAEAQGTRMVKVRWISQETYDKHMISGEWIPESKDKTAPVENGHGHDHDHHDHHEYDKTDVNGHTNGHSNGHTNGHANGHTDNHKKSE
jgi:divalent metal cation (Fe/Co/Zn/Cd) transporter